MIVSMNLTPQAMGQRYLPLLKQELFARRVLAGLPMGAAERYFTEKLMTAVEHQEELPRGRFIGLSGVMEKFMAWARQEHHDIDDVEVERPWFLHGDEAHELYLLQFLALDLERLIREQFAGFLSRVYFRPSLNGAKYPSLEFRVPLVAEELEARYFGQAAAYQTHLLHHFGTPYPDWPSLWIGFLLQLQAQWGTQLQVVADGCDRSLVRIKYSLIEKRRKASHYEDALQDYSALLFAGLREKAYVYAWGGFLSGSGITEKALRSYGSPWCEAEEEEPTSEPVAQALAPTKPNRRSKQKKTATRAKNEVGKEGALTLPTDEKKPPVGSSTQPHEKEQ